MRRIRYFVKKENVKYFLERIKFSKTLASIKKTRESQELLGDAFELLQNEINVFSELL